MSIRYVHRTNEQHQRHDLQMRSEYVQSFLRSLYYWDVALDSDQAQGLAIDLHDLGYDMNQDIHVYGLNGELLASSSPMLFNRGVLSRRMAPEAIFSDEHSVLCYEQLAGHPLQEHQLLVVQLEPQRHLVQLEQAPLHLQQVQLLLSL